MKISKCIISALLLVYSSGTPSVMDSNERWAYCEGVGVSIIPPSEPMVIDSETVLLLGSKPRVIYHEVYYLTLSSKTSSMVTANIIGVL